MAMALGVVLTATRFAKLGRRMALLAVFFMALAGLSPLSNILLLPLEQRFPVWSEKNGPPPAGIIVLGGSVDASVSFHRNAGIELNEAGDRVMAMLALARTYPQAKIIFTGGQGALLQQDGIEADEVRLKIAQYGLPVERVIFENQSRTTRENATETRKLVQPRPGERWLLVTSAWHMPRSIATFRHAGFNVEAYPVDFRTAGPQSMREFFSETSRGLRRFDIAVREWAGLTGYRLTGLSGEFLPAPEIR
ncbi:MAG: YdcF family protein [Beijerinckiaceae bacterium]